MRVISNTEYEEYRRLKAGLLDNDWISEAAAMELTGWKSSYLHKLRKAKKIRSRSINGRKHQFSRSNLESLFKYS